MPGKELLVEDAVAGKIISSQSLARGDSHTWRWRGEGSYRRADWSCVRLIHRLSIRSQAGNRIAGCKEVRRCAVLQRRTFSFDRNQPKTRRRRGASHKRSERILRTVVDIEITCGGFRFHGCNRTGKWASVQMLRVNSSQYFEKNVSRRENSCSVKSC